MTNPNAAESLATMLKRYCPEVELSAILQTPRASSFERNSPCIIRSWYFLILKCHTKMNGFELIEKLPEINFELIFHN